MADAGYGESRTHSHKRTCGRRAGTTRLLFCQSTRRTPQSAETHAGPDMGVNAGENIAILDWEGGQCSGFGRRGPRRGRRRSHLGSGLDLVLADETLLDPRRAQRAGGDVTTRPKQSVSLHVRAHHALLQRLHVAVQGRAAGAHLAAGSGGGGRMEKQDRRKKKKKERERGREGVGKREREREINSDSDCACCFTL